MEEDTQKTFVLDFEKMEVKELESKHLLSHLNKNLELHNLVLQELVRRKLSHIYLDTMDREQEWLIQDYKTYDPEKMSDQVLLDDHRIVSAWLVTLKTGKRFESPQFKDLSLEEQLKVVSDLEDKIHEEMKRRGFKVDTAVDPRDITPKFLEGISDSQVKDIDFVLHKLKISESVIDAHIFVWNEMIKRGIKHTIDDELTKKSALQVIEYPTPQGLAFVELWHWVTIEGRHFQMPDPGDTGEAPITPSERGPRGPRMETPPHIEIPKHRPGHEVVPPGESTVWQERPIVNPSIRKKPPRKKKPNLPFEIGSTEERDQGMIPTEITLENVLDAFPDEIPNELFPPYVFIIGHIANEGKIPISEFHDIDILVRGTYDPRVEKMILDQIEDPEIKKRLHITFDPKGPSVGWAYPLYDLTYKKNPNPRKMSPWELSADIELLKYHLNQKPAKFLEIWNVDELWTEWGSKHIQNTVYVQKKFDGMYFQIHRKGNEVRFFTEESARDRQDVFKKSVKELLEGIRGSYIIHTEMVEYKDGKSLRREDMIPWITSTVKELDDEGIVFHIHDITYLNNEILADKGYTERYDALKKLIVEGMKHFKLVPSTIVHSEKEFKDAVFKKRTEPFSEGAVVKDDKGTYSYRCSGPKSCRSTEMAKIKNLKEIDVMIMKRVPKMSGGQPLDQYTYICGIQIPYERSKDFKNVENIHGTCLAQIGTSYSTALKLEIGEILAIRPVQVISYIDPSDKLISLAWMFPTVESKGSEVDDYEKFKKLEAIGTSWREGLNDGDLVKTSYFAKCPYAYDKILCPLKERFCRPEYWLEENDLRFPIKCKYAECFRCLYAKPYYYGLQDTTYPTKDSERRYVMQSHIRGKSQHTDCRFEWNDHLVGFEVVGGSTEEPVTPDKWEINKGFRAEWKALQPKDWLKVHGIVPPGGVGAGVEVEGEFIIVSQGHFKEGVQKPYFKEFFIKSDKTIGPLKEGDYIRLVLRGLRLPLLDPETKKEIPGKFEIVWRFMIPSTQVPYTIDSRAIKEGFKPPKGVIPFPEEWTKTKFPEDYKKWEEYMKEKMSLSSGFVLHEVSWMGPVHVRGLPEREYYLRINDGKSRPLSFLLTDNPLYKLPSGAMSEGRVDSKWFDYVGKLGSNSPYNPNKELEAEMTILDKGDLNITKDLGDRGEEIFTLDLHGKILKGQMKLVQEEKGMETYIFEKGSQDDHLSSYPFVFQRHYGDQIKTHFDLRWKLSNNHKQELNIYKDPTRAKEGEKIFARFKDITEEPQVLESWMVIEGNHLLRKVGPLTTYIDCMDSGTLNVIEFSEDFISLEISGKFLKGFFVAKKDPDTHEWSFSRSKIATPKEPL
jgi:hypothetical protein